MGVCTLAKLTGRYRLLNSLQPAIYTAQAERCVVSIIATLMLWRASLFKKNL